MAYQLEEINRRLKEDPAGFVAECDGVYQKRLETAADRILERMKLSPIVLLSGPSGSGKTTTALKLEQELERRGVQTHTISMDNYFKTLNRQTAPRNAEGDIDYESPELLDMDLLDETFTRLSRGDWIIVPKFEFARQMRNDSRGTPLKLDKNEIAIFEGIHALNDDIAGRHPEATTLYISARSNILEGEELRFKGTWMRISRRAVRDYNFRGTDLVETLSMWYNVRRGEKCRRTTSAGPSWSPWWMPSATSSPLTPLWSPPILSSGSSSAAAVTTTDFPPLGVQHRKEGKPPCQNVPMTVPPAARAAGSAPPPWTCGSPSTDSPVWVRSSPWSAARGAWASPPSPAP